MYHSVGRILSFILLAGLLSACAPQVVKTEVPKQPAENILILTGAGMVASRADNPAYEETWMQLVGAYSKALRSALSGPSVSARLHVKQDPSESPEAALARLASDDKKDAVLQVTVSHIQNSDENTVYMEAQLMPLVYEQLANGERRIVPQSGPSRRYPMLSTTQEDLRDASISDLARKFVQELRDEGHVK